MKRRPKLRDATIFIVDPHRAVAIVLVVATVSLAAWIVGAAARSRGYYWEDDYQHLLISRSVVADPRRLLDVWGRPAETLTYLPGALLGEGFVRATSLGLFAVTAVALWRTARNLGMTFPVAAAFFLLAQPLASQLGFSALPQTVFSAILAVALWLRSEHRDELAAIVASLLPLARLEGMVVLAVWAVCMLLEGKRRPVPLLTIGVLLWAIIGAITSGDAIWLVHANPYGLLGSRYPAAGPFYVVLAAAVAFGPVLVVLLFRPLVHRPIPDRLLPGLVVGLLGFYIVAWTLPAFQSLGTPIYLVTASGSVALLAAGALDANWRRPLGDRGAPSGRGQNHLLAISALVLLVLAGIWLISPLPLQGEPLLAWEITQASGSSRPVSIDTEPAFAFYARAPDPLTGAELRRAVSSAPLGAMVLWDSAFGGTAVSEAAMEGLGYRQLWAGRTAQGTLIMFERGRLSGNPP